MVLLRVIYLNSVLSLGFFLYFFMEILIGFTLNSSTTTSQAPISGKIELIHPPFRLYTSPAGNFCVFRNALERTENFQEDSSVTFATHGSMDLVHHLAQLADRWNGPISASIFIPRGKLSDFRVLVEFAACHANIRRKVSVHPFYRSINHSCSELSLLQTPDTTCNRLQHRSRIERIYSYFDTATYPINVARNIAITHIPTTYHMLADIELIPSPNLAPNFIQMLKGNSNSPGFWRKEKEVFVVPSFEVPSKHSLPTTKKQLKLYLHQRKAVPFHRHRAYECHRIPKLAEWKDFPSTSMAVFFTTKWLRPCWEPVYISKRNIPRFDERFFGYGKNKIQQAYELCRGDYDFHILSEGFLIHRNISRMSPKLWSRVRRGIHSNNILFRRFTQELDEQYPESPVRSRCNMKSFEMNGRAYILP